MVRTHPAGNSPIPVKAYQLIYLDERVDLPDLEERLPSNSVSLKSGDSVTFDGLRQGRYFLLLSVIANVQAKVSCRQRSASSAVALSGWSVSSNRAFQDDGSLDTSVVLNSFASQLFGAGEIGPIDIWSVELPSNLNGPLQEYDSAGNRVFNGDALSDVVLTMEFDQYIAR